MCWQPHVLATDGESVESSLTLLGAQGFTAGGGRGWQGALRVCLLCLVGPGGQSGSSEQSLTLCQMGVGRTARQLHMGSNSSTCAFSKYLLSCYRTGTDVVRGWGGGNNSEEILLLKELRAWKLVMVQHEMGYDGRRLGGQLRKAPARRGGREDILGEGTIGPSPEPEKGLP